MRFGSLIKGILKVPLDRLVLLWRRYGRDGEFRGRLDQTVNEAFIDVGLDLASLDCCAVLTAVAAGTP